ncbi:response regulator [Burkholderia gladioli]|uniref:response regulator transcription factor n=1 Tax=Burkholderia gladioli TaxID=28095 RepID=UPI00264FA355|nr:response regulator [Burkholderia gladioli]MDN7501027.1 response regulator [Burkholderia gladioli]
MHVTNIGFQGSRTYRGEGDMAGGKDTLVGIVDDDEEVRDSISTLFRSAGIAVRGFEAAESLLASVELPTMRCVITDLHMHGMDGLDLQRELKARGRDVPVILMTAYPTPEARERARLLGVARFVAKPADPEWLLGEVETLLLA